MRIIATVLAILVIFGPAPCAEAISQPPIACKIPDFLMHSTYKVRITDVLKPPAPPGRVAMYFGSAVGVDLSAYGIVGKNLLLTAGHNIVDEEDGHHYTKVEIEISIQDVKNRAKARIWVPLTVIWVDPITDLALVSIEEDLPHVSVLASEDSTAIGDMLAAVGYPGGGGLTVTFGHLVSKEVESRAQEPWWYQASFPIYYGNSGGAAYDMVREQVIGIVVAGYGSKGLAPNMGYFVSLPKIKAFLDTKALRKKLDRMMSSKEGNHERAPEEGTRVPQGVPDDGQK